jgi:hypothetical protein
MGQIRDVAPHQAKIQETRVELSDAKQRTPSSQVLKGLLDQAPADSFTFGWLISALHQRSFGILMLLLGLLATAPIGSTVPGLVLAAVAVQMIAGRSAPVFPRFITARSLPTRYLFALGARSIPVLRYLENAVHPRWPAAFETAKRFVGVIVLLLTAILLLIPLPLSNIAPAIVIALIALAYIEEDGLLICGAFFAALVLLAAAAAAVWGTIVSAMLIIRFW